MYSSYSTLQRKQLTKQVYTDTQSTYLLVYAPGRHQALEHGHWKTSCTASSVW